jgi:hypothetical protein
MTTEIGRAFSEWLRARLKTKRYRSQLAQHRVSTIRRSPTAVGATGCLTGTATKPLAACANP